MNITLSRHVTQAILRVAWIAETYSTDKHEVHFITHALILVQEVVEL